jgi:hypothetical protein
VLDLPWGSWTHLVQAPVVGKVEVALPAAVGRPPLRVAAWGPGGVPRELRRRLEDEAREPPGFPFRAEHGLVSWIWEVGGGAVRDLPDAPLAVLDGTPRLAFPLLPGRGFALHRSAGSPRVEPLSAVDAPEWDLLVAAGRLEALSADDAWRLARSKWTDWVMGLGAAYPLYAHRAWDRLEEVCHYLTMLAGAYGPQLDVELLGLARSLEKDRMSKADAARLRRLAHPEAVPLFNWGVGLALRLLERAGEGGPTLVRWRQALERIQTRMSPLSVWTVWTEE